MYALPAGLYCTVIRGSPGAIYLCKNQLKSASVRVQQKATHGPGLAVWGSLQGFT